VTNVLDAGASPGAHITDGERVVAWASFAPARHYARRVASVPAASSGAVVLALAFVAPSERGRGLGRALVLAALRETVRLDADGLEAYGDHRWRERGCVLPVTWLLARGFVVHRPHPRTPLLRIDTRRVARWAESLEAALDAVVARLPRLAPEPGRAPLGQGALGGGGPRRPAGPTRGPGGAHR
jgi:GNAT superfamily N-acetyltransferase